MKRLIKLISLLTAISVTIPVFSAVSFAGNERDKIIPASVSGYVSTESGGFTLVNSTKTPVIYVDDAETEAVKRAVGDLCGDITKVTDVVPTEKNSLGTEPLDVFAYVNGKMTMTTKKTYEAEGVGIAAAYAADGKMTGMSIADNTSSNGVFTFSKVIYAPENGSMKGFIWDGIDGMKPLVSVIEQEVNLEDVDVIVGTIGSSPVLDKLISEGKLDVSDIEGKWESFKIQVIDDALVIAGSDKRGTIYGVYDLSEKMGVSPWYWWADVPIGHADSLYINLDKPYMEGEPSVKYRGIFINDEESMSEWAKAKGDSGYTELYPKIFELLLRLKANYMWPAMHTCSDAFHEYDENPKAANDYGIVMGASHCEMLTRNNVDEFDGYVTEWKARAENENKALYRDGTAHEYVWTATDHSGETVYNKELLTDYWRDALKQYGSYDNLYNIGLRGLHDEGLLVNRAKINENNIADAKALLEEVIGVQRQLIQEELGQAPEDVPQMFIPYKEVLPVYNAGLNLPDDVTVMWTNDNYGYIRQLPNQAEMQRSGGAGIYYHFSYCGKPQDNMWISTRPLAQVREEMTKAYDSNANTVWVVNVGDLKPVENQLEYFMDLANDVNGMRGKDLREYAAEKAKRDFGFNDADAAEYADIRIGFDDMTSITTPEFIRYNHDKFGYTAYGDEGEKYIEKYKRLTERSEMLYEKLDSGRKASFYELQLYFLRASTHYLEKYVYSDKSTLYINQGRGQSANKYADMSKAANRAFQEDYNTYMGLLDGKWKGGKYGGILSINFSANQITGEIGVSAVDDLCYTAMGAYLEDTSFSGYSRDIRYLDVYNVGFGSFEWKVTSDQDWVIFSKSDGTVYNDDRIWIGVDWANVPEGKQTAQITVSEVIGESVISEKTFDITVNNNVQSLADRTYAEENGVVSIEAEHYTNLVKNDGYEWSVEKDFGRCNDSLKAYPNFGAAAVESPTAVNTAVAEYKIYFESAGTFNVDLYRMPTLNERGKQRVGVAVDDAAVTTLTGTNVYQEAALNASAWARQVIENNETLSTTVTVSEPGYHTLKLYAMDTGFVVDKVVITTTESAKQRSQATYLGAPESYNSTYNHIAPAFPAEKAVDETVTTGLFHPDAVTIDITKAGNSLTGINFVKVGAAHDTLTVTAAAYAADGTMIAYETKDNVDIASHQLRDTFAADGFNLNLTGVSSVEIIVYDDAARMQLQAPVKSFKLNDNTEEPQTEYEFKYALSVFEGKPSMVMITEPDGTLAYIGQEYITMNTYKRIPAKTLDKDYYVSRVGVYGNDALIERRFYIAQNTEADNTGAEYTVYSQTFDAQPAEKDPNVVLAGAVYDGGNKNIKIKNGSLTVKPDSQINMIQGQKIQIISDIAYGKNSGKKLSYKILDSKGNIIVNSNLSAYGTGSQSLIIGADEKGENGKEMLNDNKLPHAVSTADKGMDAGYTRYTTVIDPMGGMVIVTITNTKNDHVSEYIGPLRSEVKDVALVSIDSDYQYEDRSCYADNISFGVTAEEQYGISIIPQDKNGTFIEDALIDVTDTVYGVKIVPDVSGKYMLCEGTYSYSVDYNGEVKKGTIDVNRSMLTKHIVVQYDIAYDNKLTVEPVQTTYDQNQDENVYLLDLSADPSAEENSYVTYTGGTQYTDKQSVQLSGGDMIIELPDRLVSDVTNKVVVECDMAFSAIQDKTSGYAIYDSAGNRIINFVIEEYNKSPDKYNKLEVGGETILSGKAIRDCINFDRNNPLSLKTHFTNIIDFATGEVTVNIASGNSSQTFTGNIVTTSGDVKTLKFSSTHTSWHTHAAGAAISLQAVPIERVTMNVQYDGIPVNRDNISEFIITNMQTGKTIDYTESGVLLRQGEYRYKVVYEQNGETTTKTGSFVVTQDEPAEPNPPAGGDHENENELVYLDGEEAFVSYRYASGTGTKVLALTDASKAKLTALKAGDKVTITYKLTPTDSSGEPLLDGNQIKYRAGLQLNSSKNLFVNGHTDNQWGSWGSVDYFVNLDVINKSEPANLTLVYTVKENGKANRVTVSAADGAGNSIGMSQNAGDSSAGDSQTIQAEFDLSTLTLKCADRGGNDKSVDKCFTISDLTAVITPVG